MVGLTLLPEIPSFKISANTDAGLARGGYVRNERAPSRRLGNLSGLSAESLNLLKLLATNNQAKRPSLFHRGTISVWTAVENQVGGKNLVNNAQTKSRLGQWLSTQTLYVSHYVVSLDRSWTVYCSV